MASPALLHGDELVTMQRDLRRLELHWTSEIKAEANSSSSLHCPFFYLTSSSERLSCSHVSHTSCDVCSLYGICLNKLLFLAESSTQTVSSSSSAFSSSSSSSSDSIPDLMEIDEEFVNESDMLLFSCLFVLQRYLL